MDSYLTVKKRQRTMKNSEATVIVAFAIKIP